MFEHGNNTRIAAGLGGGLLVAAIAISGCSASTSQNPNCTVSVAYSGDHEVEVTPNYPEGYQNVTSISFIFGTGAEASPPEEDSTITSTLKFRYVTRQAVLSQVTGVMQVDINGMQTPSAPADCSAIIKMPPLQG